MDFTRLLYRAYSLTLNNPVLWLFAIFLSSGFNAHFVIFRSQSDQWSGLWFDLWRWAHNFSSWPATALIILVIYIFLLTISSWAKVIFVLRAADLLKIDRIGRKNNEQPSLSELARQNQKSVLTVMGISVSMGVLVACGALIFFGPALSWLNDSASQGAILFFGSLAFIILVVFTTLATMFASFFAILHKQAVVPSLSLASDLLLSKWRTVLGYLCVLMVIYWLMISAGLGLLFFGRMSISRGLGLLPGSNLIFLPAFSWLGWSIIVALLAVIIAVLNTFFNSAFLLLFAELVKPQATELEPAAALARAVPTIPA